MQIRRARIDEAAGLASVHVESWQATYEGLLPEYVVEQLDETARTQQWRQWLEAPDDGLFVYVAEGENGIEGFVACGPRRSAGDFDSEVYAIYLRKGAQRRGAGRRLMNAAAMRLRNSGASSLGVMVLASNAARRFYEALGGRFAGERRGEVGGHSCIEAGYIWDDIRRLCAADLHWCEYGQGTPAVVLVHGWIGDSDFWFRQVDGLREHFRVITLDLPGHGISPQPHDVYSIDLFAQAVASVMDKAGVRRAVLVGHSMGGMIVRRVAQGWPSRVVGLALIDTPLALAATTYFEEKARAFEGVEGDAARRRTLERMFNAEAGEHIQQWVLAAAMATPGKDAAAIFRTMTLPSIALDAPLVLPVLVVPAAGKTMGEEATLRQMFPQVQYHRIPCGHFITLERPDELNALLVKFVREIQL